MKKIITLLASFAFFACSPNDDNTLNIPSNNATGFAKNFGAETTSDFIGEVVDADSHPIANVAIKIGTATATTDANGIFLINNAAVHKRFAYITATKAGYIEGSRALVPTSGKNTVRIMLLQSDALQTIPSGQTSEVSIYSNTKVVFDGAFMDANGNAYTGNVSVFMFHLTPSNPNLQSLMPGMLYGADESGNQKILTTFGMMNIELRGSAGQKLQVAAGHTARIEMRIDDNEIATAPATIPLWYFDQENGYWKMQGSATRQGNYYIGNVSHFTWWNADVPVDLVLLTVHVKDGAGNPTSFVHVDITTSGDPTPRAGYSDNNGEISGLVPANTALTMTVFDSCGNVISTANIGPFAADTVLPDIVISGTMRIVGNLLKCNMANVTNGYVLLKSANGHQIASVTNAAFGFSTITCNADTSFILQGVDYDTQQTTAFINYNFISPITNVGNIVACNAITEFVSFQVDSNPLVYITDNITANYNASTGLTISANSVVGNFTITGDTSVPGIYTTTAFSVTGDFGTVNGNTINNIVFSLASFGAVGSYIDMTFTGTFNDGPITHTVNGVMHVIRDN